MRHAKSAWDAGASSDHARPLNARGRADAPRVAQALAERGVRPELVVASDSARTAETWACMADTLGPAARVELRRALYHAGLDAALDALYQVDDACRCVVLLGHNPGWEDAVSQLSGQPTRFTTANAALFELDAPQWTDAGATSRWQLRALIRPRDLH